MSNGTLFKDISTILGILSTDWRHTRVIADQVKLGHSLSSVLVCAESLGFVNRQIKDEASPISDAAWSLTRSGIRFRRFVEEDTSAETIEQPSLVDVILTTPRTVREEFKLRNGDLVQTQDAFYSLLANASEEVLIFSPYIDASFAQMADTIDRRVSVRLVTTIDQHLGARPSASLARAASSHPDFQLRYLFERNEFGSQQTQIHAKLIITDKQLAYVGSANLTETSILHNFELGVLVRDYKTVQNLRNIFYDVFDSFARNFG